MKKLILIFSLVLTSTPANAITWNQFWRPFGNGGSYYYNNSYGTRPRMCNRRVYREQYVPGDRYRPGYVRRWYENTLMPCHLSY